jgi:hypothetical protein
MKLDEITVKKDEYYTPMYAIEPILEFVPDGSKVWCPFDTNESLYVEALKEKGCKVVNTSLLDGVDFFDTEIDADFIVSNPPYSLKGEVFQRLFDLGKPFAMLVGVVGLFESQKRFEMWRDNDFEIMYLNRRVSFFEDYGDQKPALNPPFSSVYICSKMLPKQIVFREINKTKAVRNSNKRIV